MEDNVTYSTFQGFRPHFDALGRVGYFKIVLKPTSFLKRFLHNVYRFVSCSLIVTYNLQHVIRVIQVRHSTNLIVDTLFILLTTLNTLGKQAAFNLRSRRIDGIINIINGPTFAASRPYHVEVLKQNALVMSRLLTLYHGAIFTCASLWTVFPVVNRSLGKEVEFTGYFPFDTTGTLAFSLALAYMSVLITFQAYGNVTMDCTIVAFYAQAKIQLKMLRYNLEQLVYVRSPLSVARFTKEVESIFGEAMVVQFFVMAWVICMTVYKIVGSELVNQSIYCSDWLILSPRFRRQLLVMMQCCGRPLAPRTAYVIPMSLDTYIHVMPINID
ncbi:hypothetical protein HF086_015240 [Spodoptera exigua]|uniref:Odorant receptor n=1 Tax=Spodoptera exigua TaxID=7107 RepID=A0A922SCE3_SPOEX|nr:hypothetical protein HF086_015240 [Spodoptera exigua]